MLNLQSAKRRRSRKSVESAIESCEPRLVLSATGGACAVGDAMAAAEASAEEATEATGADHAKATAAAFVRAVVNGSAFGGRAFAGGGFGLADANDAGGESDDATETAGNNGAGAAGFAGKEVGSGRATFEINFLHVEVTSAGIEIRGRVFHSSGNHGGRTINVNGAITATMTTNNDGEFVHVHSGTATGLLSFTGADHPMVWWV